MELNKLNVSGKKIIIFKINMTTFWNKSKENNTNGFIIFTLF